MRTLAVVGSLLFASTSAPAFAESGASSPEPATPDIQGWMTASSPDMPDDVMQVLPDTHVSQLAGTTQILYLNHNGTTLTQAQVNDSRTGASTLVGQPTAVPAWSGTDAQWQQVVSCEKAMWSRFNVTVTDVDPGNTPHVEGIFTTTPDVIGQGPTVGGISPFTIGCNVIPNSIVFIFAQAFNNSPQRVCEVAAQELAHSYGLDHELLASDPMTYLSYTGARTFHDQSVSCGESVTRACGLQGECGSGQDSVQMLLARVGPSAPGGGTDATPTVSISSPSDGAVVPPGFTVAASASDDGSVAKVDLYVDGTMVDTKTSAPYSFATPSSLSEGSHQIQTVVTDNTGQTSSAQIAVTVQAGAPNPDPGGNGAQDPSTLVGGCQTGGGAGGTALLLGLALGGLVVRRRRA